MTTRIGTLNIDRDRQSVSILWDDAPCCPEPIPLIFRHPQGDTNNVVHCKIEKTPDCIKLYSTKFRERDILWPGTQTLEIIQKDLTSDVKSHFTIHQTSLSAPIEVAKIDSKTIQLDIEEHEPSVPIRRNVDLIWDSSSSVFRDSTQQTIIGVPKWNIWNKLRKITKPKCKFNVNLIWNSFLKKYQVDTVKGL